MYINSALFGESSVKQAVINRNGSSDGAFVPSLRVGPRHGGYEGKKDRLLVHHRRTTVAFSIHPCPLFRGPGPNYVSNPRRRGVSDPVHHGHNDVVHKSVRGVMEGDRVDLDDGGK